MVLVEAPDAAGAIVTNSSGVRIDDNGYAVVPYVAPYRMTSVTLDPSGMSRDVELESSSQQVAPYAGAIARLEFKTTKGQALIIHALGPDGNALPFGAVSTCVPKLRKVCCKLSGAHSQRSSALSATALRRKLIILTTKLLKRVANDKVYMCSIAE
jgi:hypothetical protein